MIVGMRREYEEVAALEVLDEREVVGGEDSGKIDE